MSISKRKVHKNLNQSNLTQISNSENLRDSSLFKNTALVELHNFNQNLPCQGKSSRKQQFEANSTKKKILTSNKKQSIQLKTKQSEKTKQNQNGMGSYTGLARLVDQKNIVIHTQEKQIECLKNSLDRIKKQFQTTRIEFERKKLQDLSSLKKQERDNEQNIKELEILRVGMRQLKNKVEALEHQKSNLQKKTTEYLKENQQLTIKLTSIKQEYMSKVSDEKSASDLKHEVLTLKQQLKFTKELQVQKISLEERCRSYEKKINDYILRYNEIQADYNEVQIKYYRAQKESDELKMTIDETEVEKQNLKRMLQQQKKIFVQCMDRWKSRIARLEQSQRVDKMLNNSLSNRAAINELQDRFVRLQQISEVEQKFFVKNNELEQKIIELSKRCEAEVQKNEKLSIEINETNKKNKKKQNQLNSYIYEREKVLESYTKTIQELRKQLDSEVQKRQQCNTTFEQERQILKLQMREVEAKLANGFIQEQQKLRGWNAIEMKRESERKDFVEKLKIQEQNLKQKEMILKNLLKDLDNEKGQKQGLQLRLEESERQIQKTKVENIGLEEQIKLKERENEEIKKQINTLKMQIFDMQQEIKSSQLQLDEKEKILKQKLELVQGNIKHLQKKIGDQSDELNIKNEQINRLEGIVSKTNFELKSIKDVLNNYKDKIQKSNDVIQDAERQIESLSYMSKESELKWQQQIQYYRTKYQQNFRLNVQLSGKVCELQKQVTQQLNKNTEIIRANSAIELASHRLKQQKQDNEKLHQECLQKLKTQNKKLKSDFEEGVRALQQKQLKMLQLQNKIAERQEQIKNETQQSQKRLKNLATELQEKAISIKAQLQSQIYSLKQRQQRILGQIRGVREKEQNLCSTLSYLQSQIVEKDKQLDRNTQNAQIAEHLKNQIKDKDNRIKELELNLLQKNNQLEKVNKMKYQLQTEQINRLNESNRKLLQQIQENNSQITKASAQIQSFSDQCQKHKATITQLQKSLSGHHNKNNELSNQLEKLKMVNFDSTKESMSIIGEMRGQLSLYDQRLRQQSHQLNLWAQKCEHLQRQLKKSQQQCNKVSRSYLEQSNRKNKENNRQIENYKSQLKVLQEENINLQKIMDRELGKRKIIIEQLIHEKKLLYEQIGHH